MKRSADVNYLEVALLERDLAVDVNGRLLASDRDILANVAGLAVNLNAADEEGLL